MRVPIKQLKEIADGSHVILTSAEYLNYINKNYAIKNTTTGAWNTATTITNIPDDTTTVYEIFVKGQAADNSASLGMRKTLVVNRKSGTTTIMLDQTDASSADGGLTASSVSLVLSSNNVAIKVKGVNGVSINWAAEFEKMI